MIKPYIMDTALTLIDHTIDLQLAMSTLPDWLNFIQYILTS